MSDLVARLRDLARENENAPWPDSLDDAAEELREAAAEIDRLQAIVDRLQNRHAEIVGELYGKGFEVVGWHLNGDLESLDSWFEQNGWLEDAAEKARKT